MRNFKKPGFKNYLDSYDDPRAWEVDRLILQVDSLLNVIVKNSDVMNGEALDLSYDLIAQDEPESLLSHFDEKTLQNK